MATLTISFTPPVSAPSDGYLVNYREVGASVYSQVTPNPTSSPVVITGLDATKAYEGFIQAVCDGTHISIPVPFTVGALAVLNNFDFLVLRYKNNNGGLDLDTFTGFADNGLPVDINYAGNTNWVGFRGPGASYITWAGDNISAGGVEAVLINFQQLIADYPSAPDTIRVRLHAWWYNSRTNGNAQLELQTWLGGTAPTKSGFDFVKSDGTPIDNFLLDTNVTCVASGNVLIDCSQRLGEIIYNKVNKTAVLVPLSGGCGCVTCYTYRLTNEGNPWEDVEYVSCDGTPSYIDVGMGFVKTICAQENTVISVNGYATITLIDNC